MSAPRRFRPVPALLLAWLLVFSLPGQRGGKHTARDLFYSEAGLIVSSEGGGRGRFGAAKKSVIAVTLGLKYRLWKLTLGRALEADPAGPFLPGEPIRLTVETNDAGYLYIVHLQPGGLWRRLFPDPDIEQGNHFIRSGLIYPIPPEEGLELQFPSGQERLFVALSRAPIKELEALVSPPRPAHTVSAAEPPSVPEAVLVRIRSLLNNKDLVTERDHQEKAVYLVNRTARPDALVAAEIRLRSR